MRLFMMIVACTLAMPPLAGARDWHPGIGAQAPGQPMKKGGGAQFQREREKRDGPDRRDKGRLTEEERRDLHRDLDRANREIYRKR